MERRNILSAGLAGPGQRQGPGRAEIVDRLSRLDPTAQRMRGDHDGGLRRPTGPLKPAAVLVGLVERTDGLSILLTRRTDHLSDHAGQISFPGGRIEAEDADPEAAALREAYEEIGLPTELVEIVGRLPLYITGTGYAVVPVVALVRPVFTPQPDPHEVADVFEVPLSFILDPANHRRQPRDVNDLGRGFFYVLPFEDRFIWGATAAMLVNLAEVLSAPANPDE